MQETLKTFPEQRGARGSLLDIVKDHEAQRLVWPHSAFSRISDRVRPIANLELVPRVRTGGDVERNFEPGI